MTTTITPQRQFLESTLLPRFASRFAADALVLNIGAGSFGYRSHFRCQVKTADRAREVGCDETYPAESIPYQADTVDGILLSGVFDRLDDPMQAIRECYRVLKPGGSMLFGAAGLDFEWHAQRDRWRLTPGGAAYVAKAFQVLEHHEFGRVYYFYIFGKERAS